MSDSEHKFDEELISAYLDGQLSDTERAFVEQVLSENAHCRRTWNDLRAIRESLQSLPAHQVGPDFQNKVQRQIDAVVREKQGGPFHAADHETEQATGPGTTVSRPLLPWRGTAWVLGTAAAAAVLLIVLVIPDQPQVADLAQNNQPDAEGAERESDDVFRAESASDEQPLLGASQDSFDRKAELFEENSPVLSDDSLEVADSEPFQLDEADADVASPSPGREKAAPPALRPTNDAGQEILPTEEAPAPIANNRLRRRQPTGTLAGVARGSLSQIAADGPSTELMVKAMKQSGAKYLVHVIVNRADTGRQAFGRSLANNEIDYEKPAELNELAPRALGRSEGQRRSGTSEKERKDIAYRSEPAQATRQTTGAETSQLVVVQATETRLRDTVSELIRDREEFRTVDVYEFASDDDATAELTMGDKLRWVDLTAPVEFEKGDLDSIEEEAGATSRSLPLRAGASSPIVDRYGSQRDSQAARIRRNAVVRELAEPAKAGMAGAANGTSQGLSARPVAPPSDQVRLGLTEPPMAKRLGETRRGVQGSVHVLFVLSPASPTPVPSITAAEPLTPEVGPVEPVAEPDENR